MLVARNYRGDDASVVFLVEVMSFLNGRCQFDKNAVGSGPQ